MYLRRNRRRKAGEDYDYWSLVESVRTAQGPRQRIVAYIGKEPGVDEDQRVGWEQIGKLLDGWDDEGTSNSSFSASSESRRRSGHGLICVGSGWNGCANLARCM